MAEKSDSETLDKWKKAVGAMKGVDTLKEAKCRRRLGVMMGNFEVEDVGIRVPGEDKGVGGIY